MEYNKETIQNTIRTINKKLPDGVQLVAISKFHPAEMIEWAYEAGQRIFGESHVQELQQKQRILPNDIEWHFIGHLQTNKVKYIAPYISLIHAVDTEKLLLEIEKQAAKAGRNIRVLLQLHLAEEETKFGFTPDECDQLLQKGEWANLQHVTIAGIMAMASNVDNTEQIAAEFEQANAYFLHAKATFFKDNPNFRELSMGMSDDYPIALQHGTTMVRIGSKIFGPRVY